MADDTANPEALAQANAALEQAAAEAKANAKIKTTGVSLTRPVSFGGVDYPAGKREIPTDALEAEAHFAEWLEADGALSYTSERAADGAPRANKPAGTTTPARKR